MIDLGRGLGRPKGIPLECNSAWSCVCLSEPPLPGPPGGGSERQTAACLLVRPGSGHGVVVIAKRHGGRGPRHGTVTRMGRDPPRLAGGERNKAGLGSAAGHPMRRCRCNPRTRARPRPLQAAGRPMTTMLEQSTASPFMGCNVAIVTSLVTDDSSIKNF